MNLSPVSSFLLLSVSGQRHPVLAVTPPTPLLTQDVGTQALSHPQLAYMELPQCLPFLWALLGDYLCPSSTSHIHTWAHNPKELGL